MINPLTDAQLLALLDDLESDRAERKASWVPDAVGHEDGRANCCATDANCSSARSKGCGDGNRHGLASGCAARPL